MSGVEVEPRDGSPFSNGTQWEIWSSNWCERCKVDEPAREREDFANGCPLILTALSGKTPAEWLRQAPGSPDEYHCVNFRPMDEPDDNPTPEDPMPGQGELVPREPFERPKMFADVMAEIKRVEA